MATTFAAAIDSRLARDGFDLIEKINDIARKFAARGFSQPSGPMYQDIDEICSSRMEQTVATAISVYKERLAHSTDSSELKAELASYLQNRLNSLAATALESYNRPANQSSKAMMDSKVRSLLRGAQQA